MEINEILRGNATAIKGKEYLSAREYIQPFLDKMSAYTNDFRCTVKLADQLSINDKADTAIYNRVLIEAVLPEKYRIDSHDEVIGFLYGLDVKKPVCKIYRGYLNSACTNLTVFNPTWMQTQQIVPETSLTYNIKTLLESTNDFLIKLNTLKNKTFSTDRRSRELLLGHWVDRCISLEEASEFGKVKLSPSIAIDAYKNLFVDDESPYYIKADMSEQSYFTAYNAFTQVITDDKRDIINKFEKTMLVNRIFDIEMPLVNE